MDLLRTLTLPSLALLLSWLAFSLTRPPEPLPVDADLTQFSAMRAMEHIKIIAQEPHPTGSVAIYKVRDYLLKELKKLGMETQVMRREVHSRGESSFRNGRVATIENIVARLPGINPKGKALMLSAHYDSRENTHGASDDGHGVATILETIRTIKASVPLDNDILVVFTDGEESGLFGAQAFVQSEQAEQVGLVLNLEARGTSGPMLMFETSEGNGALIEEFAKASPLPLADSLSFAIYRSMPNDTDLTVFKEASLPGLNLGFIEGYYHYHTMGDNAQNIDPASVQHAGSYALALTRHFGQLPLPLTSKENHAFFNPLGKWLVHYSLGFAYIIGAGVLLGFVLVLRTAHKAGLFDLSQLGYGFAAVVTTVLTVIIWVQGSNQVWYLLPTARHKLSYVMAASSSTILLGCLLITTGIIAGLLNHFTRGSTKTKLFIFTLLTLLIVGLSGQAAIPLGLTSLIALPFIWWRIKKPVPVMALYYAGYVLWSLIALLMLVHLPEASHIVVWPLALALAFDYLRLKKDASHPSSKNGINWLLPIAGGAYGIILLSPAILTIHSALGMVWPAAAMLLVVLLSLLWLLPLQQSGICQKQLVAPSIFTIGVALILILPLTSPFDSVTQEPDEVFYYQDGNSGEAFWSTSDQTPARWAAPLFQNKQNISIARLLPGYEHPLVASSAPHAALPEPFISGKTETSVNGKRQISFVLHSPNRAEYVNLFFSDPDSIHSATLNGHDMSVSKYNDRGWWRWRYYALPEQGINIQLTIEQGAEVSLKVVEIAWGWPQVLNEGIPQRLPHQMPRPYSYSDASVISKDFRL